MPNDKDTGAFKINRNISEFEGDSLIVGCGPQKTHHFSFLSEPIHAKKLHPSNLFYHISLASDYSDEGVHDVEGDFLNDEVIEYLSQKRFNFICFEAVTEIFSSSESREKALKNAKALLAKDGICFIYFGGRDDPNALDETIKQFKFSYSFTYGMNETWSLIASDVNFDLLEKFKDNHYLDYMCNVVIKRKGNLSVSYNYEERALNMHIKSSDPSDVERLIAMNPFAKERYVTLSKTIEKQLSDKNEDSAKSRPKTPGK